MKMQKLTFIIISTFIIGIITLSSISINYSFAQKLDNTFVNENCGISIEYPKKWVTEDQNFSFEDLSKTLVEIKPKEDDSSNLILIEIYDYTLKDKSYKSIAEFEEQYIKSSPDNEIIESTKTEISGFPTQKISYIQGLPGEYEFEKDKIYFK